MTPAARIQASIEILDEILRDVPVEKALTGWARRSRFAGSKDRAAVRDHVFGALRCKRSFAALGGAETGRGLMLGALRAARSDPNDLFTGVGHAPAPVGEDETGRAFLSEAEQYDIPDWLWSLFQASLKDQAINVAQALQTRAPVHLRVNLIKSDSDRAIAALAADGITARAHDACDTALEVLDGARKVAQSQAFLTGLVELQDAASQAIVADLNLQPGQRVLDYCAGGGGKSLAIAAHVGVEAFAHDVNPARMRDLPDRAKRAGAQVTILTPDAVRSQAPFDVVLVDAPCSGSGSWRRAPAGKWALTPERLKELSALQLSILEETSGFVSPDGTLAYATCSMLNPENQEVVENFLGSHSGWNMSYQKLWLAAHGTDGFFTAHLTR
ncbi:MULTISPECIES: RsmB/NOP family class I SAM-dependent RNA methyltransferase [unclassified Ruegeria]|uniref:RsmB/NOP family class I SAM-dependent RNA methyltransferase n=1 Tax=unclassified Ruegeria TaxID=2625375 RepID=UPI001ADCE6CA|nr:MULTISPECIES: RsmB/NOP family class I SAM-dependent RNA methyltransferase [unclassified Ruegeria]MBO9410685.1 RsmB/NOP family class I SAM-dependent RNA methyltransferase [Ruegeria sp. R8_1]MBO9414096.1 RsmB/NOP family class I SAM-dependent RNA methyltransferase [Ruegeria sp. R8_2]